MSVDYRLGQCVLTDRSSLTSCVHITNYLVVTKESRALGGVAGRVVEGKGHIETRERQKYISSHSRARLFEIRTVL